MPAEGHYPYQAPIDAYGNGGFRFAGMSHRGSLLCLPTGMHAWGVTTPAELTRESLAPVFAAAAEIDVLLIGLGSEIAMIDPALRDYNILLAEQRAVAAALIAVERPR